MVEERHHLDLPAPPEGSHRLGGEEEQFLVGENQVRPGGGNHQGEGAHLGEIQHQAIQAIHREEGAHLGANQHQVIHRGRQEILGVLGQLEAGQELRGRNHQDQDQDRE